MSSREEYSTTTNALAFILLKHALFDLLETYFPTNPDVCSTVIARLDDRIVEVASALSSSYADETLRQELIAASAKKLRIVLMEMYNVNTVKSSEYCKANRTVELTQRTQGRNTLTR